MLVFADHFQLNDTKAILQNFLETIQNLLNINLCLEETMILSVRIGILIGRQISELLDKKARGKKDQNPSTTIVPIEIYDYSNCNKGKVNNSNSKKINFVSY